MDLFLRFWTDRNTNINTINLLNFFVFSLFSLLVACTTLPTHEGNHVLNRGVFYVPGAEKPFTGIHHRYRYIGADDEKQIYQSTAYKEGLKDGIQETLWDGSGSKRSMVAYVKGKREGRSMTWYPSGAKQRLEVVEQGELIERSGWYESGEIKTSYDVQSKTTTYWYQTGEKKSEWKTIEGKGFSQQNTVWHKNSMQAYFVNYVAGRKQGQAIGWDERGNKIEVSNYIKGSQHGVSTHWYAGGGLKEQSNYWKGNKIAEESWHPNGAIKNLILVKDGKFVDFSRWYPTGKKEATFDVNAQKLTTRYPNGTKNTESRFKGTRLHGKTARWDQEGNKLEQLIYSDGEKHGESNAWYSNGQQRLVAHYRRGKLDGILMQWYVNGKIKEMSSCKKGIKWVEKTWHPNHAKKSVFRIRLGDIIYLFRDIKGKFTEFSRWYETGEKEYSYDVSTKILTRWSKNGDVQSVLQNKGTKMHDMFAECKASFKRETETIFFEGKKDLLI